MSTPRDVIEKANTALARVRKDRLDNLAKNVQDGFLVRDAVQALREAGIIADPTEVMAWADRDVVLCVVGGRRMLLPSADITNSTDEDV